MIQSRILYENDMIYVVEESEQHPEDKDFYKTSWVLFFKYESGSFAFTNCRYYNNSNKSYPPSLDTELIRFANIIARDNIGDGVKKWLNEALSQGYFNFDSQSKLLEDQLRSLRGIRSKVEEVSKFMYSEKGR